MPIVVLFIKLQIALPLNILSSAPRSLSDCSVAGCDCDALILAISPGIIPRTSRDQPMALTAHSRRAILAEQAQLAARPGQDGPRVHALPPFCPISIAVYCTYCQKYSSALFTAAHFKKYLCRIKGCLGAGFS